MEEAKELVEYLKNIFNSIYDNLIRLGYNEEDIIPAIYKYILDDDTDFSDVLSDYYNCENFDDVDRQLSLINLMYAAYYLVKNYDSNGEQRDLENEEDIDEELISFSVLECDEETLVELFNDESNGISLVDNFVFYLSLSDARHKRMVTNLCNKKEFVELCNKNNYLKSLVVAEYSLDVTGEAYLTDMVVELYEKYVDYTQEVPSDDSNIKDILINDKEVFKKIKKNLILESLMNDLKIRRRNYTMKSIFSIMIRSLYIDIYNNLDNEYEVLKEEDYNFFNLINEGKLSFEELFNNFIHHEIFSTYVLSRFYINNIDKDSQDFNDSQMLFEDDKIKEKIKKYYFGGDING